MLKLIDFMSAARFESLAGGLHIAVITALDPGSSEVHVPMGFGPSLRLHFNDIDQREVAVGGDGVMFSARDAQVINSFIAYCLEAPAVEGMVVVCEGGMSRSAAIAWYASSFGAMFEKERRIDGFNETILRMLEIEGGRVVNRPVGMLVRPGDRACPLD